MSMPPNKTHLATYTERFQTSSGYRTTNYGPFVSRDCVSSVAGRAHSPFVYHGKTQLIDGQLFVEGETVNGNNGRKYKFREYQLMVKRGVWREPHAYSCSLDEGNIDYFHGYVGYRGDSSPFYTVEKYGDLRCSDYGLLVPSLSSGVSPDLRSRAVTKALSKLKNQKVNLAQAFAEREQTVHLVRDTLAGLTHAAVSLRKKDLRGIAEGLKLRGKVKMPRGQNFHNRWLELQYGWKPLYSDVYGAVQALHQKDQEDLRRYSCTVTGKAKEHVESWDSQLRNYCYRATRHYIGTDGVFVRLDYYLANPFSASLSALGITNPLTVAWEITPWSFVWDWFNPIGGYLNALDAHVGFQFKAGTVSSLRTREWDAWLNTAGPQSGYVSMNAYGASKVRQLRLTRELYSSSPLPRIPGFKNPFPRDNTAHFQNAVALFASSLDGRKHARI